MSDTDVNQTILNALQKQWPKGEGDPWNKYWVIGTKSVEKFDTSKVALRLVKIDYPGLGDKVVHSPVVLQEAQVRNPSPATIKETFAYNHSFTDSYEWSVTAGLKLTASAKFEAGLPIVGQGEVSTSAEISVGAGLKSTHSESVSYSGSVEVQIPPQTSVAIKAVLMQGKVDAVPFKATLQAYGPVGGYFAYGYSTSGPSHFEWNWADLDTGVGWTDPGFKKVPPLKDDSVRTFVLEGLFSADCGFNVNVVAEPLAKAT